LNAWNGYTEGFAGMPTLQYGDVNHLWAETLFRMTDDKHPMELVYEFSTKGWTLISLPGVADDMSVGALFPDLKYDWALTYNQGYLKTSTLEPNKGYWLYIKEPSRQHLDVLPVYAVSYTFDKPGWYLMGGIAEAKDFSEPVCTPPNGVQPPVYAYDPGSGSYLTTNVLEPQTGYWMMISNACELNVSPDYLTPLARPSKDKWLSSIPPLPPDIQEIERDREHNKEQYRLDNYPNPFNTSTTISFYLKKYTHVNLSVFNSHGQWVQTLIDQGSSPGTHTVYWNGKNQNGADVASGVYIAMLEKNGSRQIKKLMLLR
jgi:hypothetical protein